MDIQLYFKISSLSKDLQKKVEAFIDSLKQAPRQPESQKVKFGLAKGKVRIQANFDDPVPGMETYTQ